MISNIEVIRRDMFVSDLCGLYEVCQEASLYEPWTSEAESCWDEENAPVR